MSSPTSQTTPTNSCLPIAVCDGLAAHGVNTTVSELICDATESLVAKQRLNPSGDYFRTIAEISGREQCSAELMDVFSEMKFRNRRGADVQFSFNISSGSGKNDEKIFDSNMAPIWIKWRGQKASKNNPGSGHYSYDKGLQRRKQGKQDVVSTKHRAIEQALLTKYNVKHVAKIERAVADRRKKIEQEASFDKRMAAKHIAQIEREAIFAKYLLSERKKRIIREAADAEHAAAKRAEQCKRDEAMARRLSKLAEPIASTAVLTRRLAERAEQCKSDAAMARRLNAIYGRNQKQVASDAAVAKRSSGKRFVL